MSWMLVQTVANAERIAEASLKSPHRACSVYFPKIKVRRSHAGRVDYVERPFLPRYGFVDDGRGYDVVRSAPGVSHVVSYGSSIVDRAVLEIMERESGGFIKLAAPLADGTHDFKAGDRVRIIGGPMMGWKGMFSSNKGFERVQVLLDRLGLAELDLDLLERA